MSARRFRGRRRSPSSASVRPPSAGPLFDSSDLYDKKNRQLCRQAKEALSLALANSRDPVLLDCVLVDVQPAGGHLEIHVVPHDDVEALHAALDRARGYLRAEVAQHIHRKRTPELRFVIRPRPSGLLEEES